VHNLLDFSLFEPGPMCFFAMLVGAVLGARREPAQSPSRALAGVGLIFCIILGLAGSAGVVLPIAQAESIAQQANNEIRANRTNIAAAHLRDAFERLWIPNADYAFRAAVAMQQAGMPADESMKMLAAAIAADPVRSQCYRAVADFELRKLAPDPGVVISNYEKASALDPDNVALHRDFADALQRLGQRDRAIEQYRLALQYNDVLPPDEPKRMSAAQVEQIQARIRSLEG
jgi:tetratricopeptide (TPR) repeat protein